jgi:sulfur relay (sulfurtransferase) complex TusBCD TusD component (DsrE family)
MLIDQNAHLDQNLNNSFAYSRALKEKQMHQTGRIYFFQQRILVGIAFLSMNSDLKQTMYDHFGILVSTLIRSQNSS